MRPGVSAGELFQLADLARDLRRIAEAEAMYDALTRDPNDEVRAEAAFAKE